MADDGARDRDGRVVEDRVLAAGEWWSGIVEPGQMLRLIDLEGQQAVDFLCYNAADPSERYNAADTMKLAGSLFVSKGVRLYSDMGNPMFTVVEDSCGRHDTIGGCCSRESNLLRYGVENTPNCRDNFVSALAPYGLGKKDVVANINFFMYVPVGPSGEMAIAPGPSKPGDHVDLRAEMRVLVALSNCPQRHNPANNFNPTPIRLTIRAPA
jgi:urea carboxylase-associated protein 1